MPNNNFEPYIHYTKTYQIGRSVVHIIAPDISRKERDIILERIREVTRTLWLKNEKIRFDN